MSESIESPEAIEAIHQIDSNPEIEATDPSSTSVDANAPLAQASQTVANRPVLAIGCPPPVPRSESPPGDPRIELIRLADSLARDRSASLLVRYLQLRRLLMNV
jgi:hypothetical protein